MSEQVLLSVGMTMQDGKFEEFQAIVREIVALAKKEPGTLGYEWYKTSDGKSWRLIEIYMDADGLLAHLQGPALKEFPRLMKMASLSGVQVFGEPGPKAREILTGMGAEIFSHSVGLRR